MTLEHTPLCCAPKLISTIQLLLYTTEYNNVVYLVRSVKLSTGTHGGGRVQAVPNTTKHKELTNQECRSENCDERLPPTECYMAVFRV